MSATVGDSVATITLQDLLGKAEFDSQHLNQQCSENDLVEIATRYCDKWQMIGYHLKLEQNEITAINDNYKTAEEKRVRVLMKWKDRNAYKATYKVLIEAFLSNKQVDTAQKIIEWLKHQSEC